MQCVPTSRGGAEAEGVRTNTSSTGGRQPCRSGLLRRVGKVAAAGQYQAHSIVGTMGDREKLSKLSGHSQQIDDISFVFERPRIGLHEAMIDCDLADLIEFVFTDPDISEAAR